MHSRQDANGVLESGMRCWRQCERGLTYLLMLTEDNNGSTGCHAIHQTQRDRRWMEPTGDNQPKTSNNKYDIGIFMGI